MKMMSVMPVESGPNAESYRATFVANQVNPNPQRGPQDRGDDRARQHLAPRDPPVRDDAVDDQKARKISRIGANEPDQPDAGLAARDLDGELGSPWTAGCR